MATGVETDSVVIHQAEKRSLTALRSAGGKCVELTECRAVAGGGHKFTRIALLDQEVLATAVALMLPMPCSTESLEKDARNAAVGFCLVAELLASGDIAGAVQAMRDANKTAFGLLLHSMEEIEKKEGGAAA